MNIPPGVPAGLQALVDGQGVHLSWQPAANAWTYGVFRNGGPQISPNNQTAPAFTDRNIQNAQTYTYTVKTWNVTGFSAPATVNVTVNIPPGVPAGLQAVVDGQGVHLSWQPAANAWTYGVFRNGGPQISPNNQTATVFTDPNVQNGQTYTYTVETWNVTGFSAPAALTVSDNPGPPPTGQDWPTYLYDNTRSGASTEAILTPANAPTLGLKWSLTTGNSVVASAAVVNGVAYIGSWDGFEYALNASTGAVIWKTSIGITTNPNCSYPVTAGVTSGATVQNGVVYVGGGDSFWYALDANTGAILWKVFTGDNSVAGAHYNWSSPLIYNGFAYIGIASNCDNPLVQGQLLQVNLTTHVVTNTAKFVPDGGQVGGGVWTSPTVDAATNTVFVDTGTINQYTQNLAQAVVALDANTLAVKSSWQLPFQVETFDSDWGSTPTLTTDSGGNPLLAVANKNGVLYTFNRNNIAAGPIWQQQLAVGGECPTCGDGTISPGAFVSNFTIGSYTGPVLFYAAGANTYNGQGNQGGVWAFNPGTGALLWFHPTNGPILGALSFDNGLLAYGQGNTFEVTNAANGQALYDYTTKGPMYGAAAFSRGQIYIGGTDNNVYAFGLGSVTTPPADANCPVGFTCQDIGGATPGSEVVNGGGWTITASGAKIHDISDQFRFISKNIAGDTQLTTELTQQSTQNTLPQAGLMMRESPNPASPFYAMVEYPNNNIEGQPLPKVLVWYRPQWGGTAIEATKLYPAPLPRFMMIQRVGDTFSAASSTDGVHYTTLTGTTQQFVMPTTLMSGIAVDSGANGTFGTAVFTPMTNGAVNITPVLPGTTHPCPATWTGGTALSCQAVGNPNPPGDQTLAGGTYTMLGAGTGITSGVFATYGHRDQFHYISQALSGDQTFTAKFLGFTGTPPANAQAGLMMRASSDPGSPYYSILAYPNGTGVVQWRVNPNMTARFAFVKLPTLAAGTWLQIIRYTDPTVGATYSAATSPDGVNWTPVQSTTAAINLGASPTLGLAASAAAINVNPSSSFSNISVAATTTVPPGVCPVNYSCADVGNSHRTGYQTYQGHVWTMQSSGDIWDVYDTMRLIWQPMSGDGTVSARVVSMQNPADGWAKSGVMIRGGTPGASDPSAPYYGVFLTPANGLAVQWRPSESALTSQLVYAIPGGTAAPIYLMVAKFTDVAHNNTVDYTAYYSTDNVNWNVVPGSTVALNIPGALSAAMAASSHSTANTMTTTFDSWSVLSSSPPPPGGCPAQWNCEDINGALPGGSQNLAAGVWSISAGGGDIWDVADQFHLVSQTLTADGTVSARVSSVTNAGVWAKGGVMLRNATGDPDPGAPNYSIFVTPSNGIVVQWRTVENGTTSQIQIAGAPGAQTYVMVDRWTDTTAHVTYYQALTSTTGAPGSWTAVPGSLQQVAGLTGSLLAGIATDSWNQGTAATWTIDSVAISNTGIAPVGACPGGWTCQDIGGATPAGAQSLSAGSWTVQAGGNDIWNTSDSFRLISQSLGADGTFSAHVASQTATDPWAKAGVMLRGSNDPGSPYYGVLVTPNNGVVVQWRTSLAGNTNQIQLAGAVPLYLRVSRWTDTSGAPLTYLTAYTSPNGTNWTAIPGSTQQFSLTGALLAGMAVTSHNGAALSTVGFDGVALSNTAPVPAGICLSSWTCQDIGGATPAGNQTPADGTGTGWTINGGGGDIWNPADSFRYVTKALPGDGTLTARVKSQAGGDPAWAKSGVMIRSDNTNTSAYFAVLVTPANGIVVQYRATGGDTVNSIQVASAPMPAGAPPVYLRITRVASTNTFTAWYSPDNVTWTQLGAPTVAANLTGTLLEGLAVCSHNTSVLSTAVFDSVSP
ncbi:MAG TPA: PQQ-binding-like beta-propeller repeat protein [Candidatus Acidoferrales bacterium]|nr:PQQ-binding-like beta-propeller repeat protein [Candidatus Acidoferrales bacterium]